MIKLISTGNKNINLKKMQIKINFYVTNMQSFFE